MPSSQHEGPVAVVRTNPDLLAWLLRSQFERKVPEFEHARPHATDVRVMVPRTYHADSMVLFCDAADRPLMGAVLEVQRGWDIGKLRTWKLYVAQLEAEVDVATALLVYCPDPAIARRYRTLFEEDESSSLTLRPLIFTPDDLPLVTSVELARENPLLAGLPPAARTQWEAFMTATAGYEFQSELLRNLSDQYKAEHQARGEALGEARGEAQAILTVLEERGLPVPDEIRDQIMACTDIDQLATWLRRAVTATTADDVVRA
ncbi:hypothetical protein ACQPZX_37735 [Actinoplanes sp. CA-142083]|uniref:hypothetical protein n=1 Tax=Actinoplanes sp. CA-142083 TaxID=3239903 RepID=UPI003D9102E6